jgi:hypothetical protein
MRKSYLFVLKKISTGFYYCNTNILLLNDSVHFDLGQLLDKDRNYLFYNKESN